MKFVAVASLVGLASAAFKYEVTTTDATCVCDLQDDTNATAVNDCLRGMGSSCAWTVTASFDGTTPLTTPSEACRAQEMQAFEFPAELDHGLSFPPADVQLTLAADAFHIDFAPASSGCNLSISSTLLDPDCITAPADALDIGTVTPDTNATWSWEETLTRYAKYVVFVPESACWTEDDSLNATGASVNSYVITASYTPVPETSTQAPVPTTSTEAPVPTTSTEADVPKTSGEAATPGTSDEASVSETSGESNETEADETGTGVDSSAEAPASEADAGANDNVGSLIATSGILFATGYLFL